MKISKKTKIILILMCLFLITGCGTTDDKNDKKLAIAYENEEIYLGDCKDDCNSKPFFQRIACLAGCVISGGNNNGGNNGWSLPTSTPEPTPCKKGYTSANGYEPGCKMKEITSVWVNGGKRYREPDSATGSFGTIVVNPSDAIRTLSGSGSGLAVSSGSVVFSNPNIGSGSSCAENSIVVTAKNSAPSSAKSSEYKTCVYCKSFGQGESGYWKYSSHPSKASSGSTSGCVFFSDPVNSKYWTKGYSRCCGVSPPESDYGFCVGDEPYIGIATKVEWIPGPCTTSAGHYCYEGSDDWPKSDCRLMEGASACKSGLTVTPAVKKEADKCEDTVKIQSNNQSQVCASEGTNYYSIKCETNVETNFDMDDNLVNSNYSLYAGQGFKNDISVSEIIKCKATFNANEWVSSYNKIMAKMKKVTAIKKSTETAYEAYQRNTPDAYTSFINKLKSIDGSLFTRNTESYIYELYTVAKEIEQIVIDYNNYQLTDNYDTTANLRMAYSLIDDKNNKSYNYIYDSSKTMCEPTKKVTATHKSVTNAARWLDAPKNYTSTYKKIVNLYPKEVKISKIDGKVTSQTDNTIEGGNKIYIDPKAKAQTISPIKIVVEGLARNNSSVENTKCKIKILEHDLLYRPIELSNPFINKSWNKGDNWTNSLYDFTSTIRTDTWSRSPLYTIDLPNSMVGAIRRSNINNKSAYLGLCDKLDRTNQDEATRFICNFLK